MSIDIGAAFSDGIDEFLSKKGAMLMGLFVIVGLAGSLATGSVLQAIANAVEGTEGVSPAVAEQLRAQAQFGFDIGLRSAIMLFLVYGLGAELARIVGIRALADSTTNTVLPEHYTGNVLTLFLYRVILAVVLFILYGVLALVLVLPSVFFLPLALFAMPLFLYVALALYFAPIAVVVDEVGPLDAITRAWEYAKGNRLNLLAIAIGVVVISFVLSAPNLLFTGVATANDTGVTAITQSPIAVVVSSVFTALSTVFSLAVATSTYLQLSVDSGDAPNAGGSANADQFGTETEF